jgi:hypothetical protein
MSFLASGLWTHRAHHGLGNWVGERRALVSAGWTTVWMWSPAHFWRFVLQEALRTGVRRHAGQGWQSDCLMSNVTCPAVTENHLVLLMDVIS